MKTNRISVLDCTLRDGGYINNWNFGAYTIKDIISNLINAHIDIVECGFIRNVTPDLDSSIFSSMKNLSDVIYPKNSSVQYAVMIEQHNYVPELIPRCSERTADIIRLTFRKNEWNEAKVTAKQLIDKGYRVCIQPVGTVSYDISSLISLIHDVNNIKPYAFYLVDTLGVMYIHEMRKYFYLIDDTLSKNIALGFHSHNNLQMSFANAQELITLKRERNIIIDSSCYGMGRGVGNLATELITDYINSINQENRFLLTPILNIVDKHLMPIFSCQKWGYDLPFFLSAKFSCHPNYASNLIKKGTLNIEMVEKILTLIPKEHRDEYNPQLIDTLYKDLQSYSIDDTTSYQEFLNILDGKGEVLILGSGASIKLYEDRIKDIIFNKFVIALNFIPDNFKIDALFVSNMRRLKILDLSKMKHILATSNLKLEMPYLDRSLFFDYSSLLGEGEASDNSGSMLIRLLRRSQVHKLWIAGCDGFDVDTSDSYYIDRLNKPLDYNTAKKLNNDISRQLALALKGFDYEFVTPTKYQFGNI